MCIMQAKLALGEISIQVLERFSSMLTETKL